MREILFRGKCLYDGKWVVGDLSNVVHDSAVYVFPGDGYDSPDCYEVDPATVGQYTGLKDADGNRIFEGDILKGKRYRDYGQWGEYKDDTCTVSWDNSSSGFSPFLSWCSYHHELKNYRIIGNIHDNPELLEGRRPG